MLFVLPSGQKTEYKLFPPRDSVLFLRRSTHKFPLQKNLNLLGNLWTGIEGFSDIANHMIPSFRSEMC